MFEKLEFDMDKVYPTLVVSTMSSGKSTLINALVGTDLLPSMNRACTAKAVAILDNDRKPQFEIHAVDSDGKYSHIDKATKKAVIDFNESNDVTEMIIEGEIKGIKNSKKSLLLIDTPGINNSMDLSHQLVTRKVMDDYQEGLILYIINASQMGTYDDSCFMSLVAKKLEDNVKFKIIFVVNKMDLIDPQKENPDELVKNCKKYIEDMGIQNPVIVPISASSALLFKKVLENQELTELEEEDFLRNYKHFKREGFSLQDYMNIPRRGDLADFVEVDGVTYTKAQIYAALENTGLPFLEKQIDETLVRSLKMTAPKITMKRSSNPPQSKNDKPFSKHNKAKSNKRKRG